MTNDYIPAEIAPPRTLLELDEEMVSNGILPYIHVGELLEWGIWHLAGQMKAPPGLWLGVYSSAHGVTIVYDGVTRTRSFLLKPGARSVRVNVLVSIEDLDVESFEVQIALASGAYSSDVVFTRRSGYAILLEQAVHLEYTFEQVGDYPGMLKNRDESATVTITPNGVHLRLWSMNIHQLFTGRLEQTPT